MAAFPEADRGFLLAVAARLIPGVASLDAGGRRRYFELIEAALAGKPPALARQLRLFVSVVRWLPALRWGLPLEKLSGERQDAALRWFMDCPLALPRKGFWGLKTLLFMDGADCLLALGCRFSEVATGSYGITPPENLIHVDILAEALNRNYPAKLAIASDAGAFLRALLPLVKDRAPVAEIVEALAAGHAGLREKRLRQAGGERVGPAAFFAALQREAGPEAIYSADSGNGTFLAMEHLRLDAPGRFLAPVDYSCMGYATPAAIGAKLANPKRPVIALEGDGALLMTGLELMTAYRLGVGVVVCVLRDGELGQIAQFQRTALDRDTCSVLPPYRAEDFARLTGCEYLAVAEEAACERVLGEAFAAACSGKPVLVEIAIDYSRKTFFTQGVVATNFWRLPLGERLRMLGRVAARKLGLSGVRRL